MRAGARGPHVEPGKRGKRRGVGIRTVEHDHVGHDPQIAFRQRRDRAQLAEAQPGGHGVLADFLPLLHAVGIDRHRERRSLPVRHHVVGKIHLSHALVSASLLANTSRTKRD